MHHRLIPIALLLAATGLAASGEPPAFDPEAARKAVLEASHTMIGALESGDKATVESLLSPGWEMFITLPRGQDHATRESFLARFERNFRPGGVDVTVNRDDCRVTPDMAFCRTDEFFDWNRGEGNPPHRVHFMSTYVWEMREGRWQTVHVHHSYVAPPPEPPAEPDTEGSTGAGEDGDGE